MLPTPRVLPGGPIATAGSIRIVRPHSVKILPASLVCLWLLSGIRCLQAQSDNPENGLQPAVRSATEVLQRVRDSFARIRSTHYTFESTSYSSGPARTHPYTSKTDAEFALENEKFYTSVNGSTTRGEGSSWFAATAYDGSKYQRLDNTFLTTSSSSQNLGRSPYSLQPVMYPFMFAYMPPRPLTWEWISNQELWNELGSRAKLESSAIVDGHPCEVVSFTKQSGTNPPFEMCWKVYAARDLGYYPVRQTASHGNTRSVLDVTEWKVVPGAMGDVVIPIKIKVESRDDGGSLLQSRSYSVRLISVNEEVPQSLFSLMRFKPERVKHLD